MSAQHQELKKLHNQLQKRLALGWGLWSAMKKVVLPVLAERDQLKQENTALSNRLVRLEGLTKRGPSTDKRAMQGKEPTDDDIRQYLQDNPGCDSYNARERLRERAYGGKPPHGYTDWGTYWKSF